MTIQEQINQIIKQYEELLAKQDPDTIQLFKEQELENITELFGELVSHIDKQTKVPFGTIFISKRTGHRYILSAVSLDSMGLINTVNGSRWTEPKTFRTNRAPSVRECHEAFGDCFNIQIMPEEEN